MRRGYEDQPMVLSVSRALFHLLANFAIFLSTGVLPSGKASDFDSDKCGASCTLTGSNPVTPASVGFCTKLTKNSLRRHRRYGRVQTAVTKKLQGTAPPYRVCRATINREDGASNICRVGGIGRHSGFKNHRAIIESSSLSLGTIYAALAELADATDLRSVQLSVRVRDAVPKKLRWQQGR